MNKSVILSGVACIGVVATGILAGRSALKAEEVLKEKKPEGKWETFKAVAPSYIPPIAVGAATIACIVLSHRLDAKTIAGLSAAAAASEEGYRRFKGKVKDILGEEKVHEIEAEIAKEDWGAYPPLPTDGTGEKALYYDSFSKRYFRCTPDRLTEAIYHLNRNFQLRGYSYLNEFYQFIGIEDCEVGDICGWSQEWFWEGGLQPWIDIWIQDKKADSGEKVSVIGFDFDPSTYAVNMAES